MLAFKIEFHGRRSIHRFDDLTLHLCLAVPVAALPKKVRCLGGEMFLPRAQ